MVTVPWISSIFKPQSKGELFTSELDQNKKGINRLIELTKRLDSVDTNIHKNEEFLRAVTDCLYTPIWVKDSDGHFIFVNITCAKVLLDTTPEKALSLTDADLKGSAIAKVCMESDRRVQESLKTSRFIEHARYPTFDLWLDTTKSPLILGGELKGIVGSAIIISDLVSKSLRDLYSEAGLLEVDADLRYSMEYSEGKRCNDLSVLLKEGNEIIGTFGV